MSKSNTFENDFLKAILWGTSIANISDNASSSPATGFYLALHTADPGETGDQSTSECVYGAYERQVVSRSSGGFSISGNVASLASVTTFPTATSGTEIVTYFSLGTDSSGTGKILWSGVVSPNISVSTGIIPQLGTGTTITED